MIAYVVAAARVRGGARRHRVVGVAAADASGAGRLRDRSGGPRGRTAAHGGDARAVRARPSDRRAVPSVDRRRAAVRFRPLAHLRSARRGSDSRTRGEHADPRERPRSSRRRSSACRSASSPAAAAAASAPAIVRAVSIVLLSTPPFLMSLFLVFLAARTGWLPVGGMGTARHLDRVRPRRWRCRSRRCSSGCSRRRCAR